jgi:hypothetical protein
MMESDCAVPLRQAPRSRAPEFQQLTSCRAECKLRLQRTVFVRVEIKVQLAVIESQRI